MTTSIEPSYLATTPFRAVACESGALAATALSGAIMLAPIDPVLGGALGVFSGMVETTAHIALIKLVGIEWALNHALSLNLVSKAFSILVTMAYVVKGGVRDLGALTLITVVFLMISTVSSLARLGLKLYLDCSVNGFADLFARYQLSRLPQERREAIESSTLRPEEQLEVLCCWE